MAIQEPVPPTAQRPPDTPAAGKTAVQRRTRKTSRSRAGAAWVGICIAAVLLIALIIFILQNRQPVLVTFLSMQGNVPQAIALLIAGIGVGIVALVIGTVRVSQLRRQIGRTDDGAEEVGPALITVPRRISIDQQREWIR